MTCIDVVWWFMSVVFYHSAGGGSRHQPLSEAIAFTLRRHRAGGIRGHAETFRADDARGLLGLGQLQVLQHAR